VVDNEYDRRTEDGVIPAWYNLKEMASRNYKARTKQNALDSDATLIITPTEELTGGSLFTRNLAIKHGKPYCMYILARSYLPGFSCQGS
jgi:putative molybdenum carrier protein